MKKNNITEEIAEVEVSEFNMPESETKIQKIKRIFPKRILIIFLVLVALLGVYGSYYFYNKYKALNVDANIEAQKETERLVGLLDKLMELPQGETPTVATISDKEKLKDQPFFESAQNGDILFAYTKAMKAILYRPSSNKIINVAPITINQAPDVKDGVKKTVPIPTSGTNQ